MEKQNYTSADLRKLFRIDNRYKTIQIIYKAEERGEIPKAQRISRGRVEVRNWTLSQLPDIGKRFGFLKPTNKQHVICKYIQKGGVLKTTTSFNEARLFALNGIKTLIIGLDFECSITDLVLPKHEIVRLEENTRPLGLYHFLVEKAPLDKVIKKTSLPTLDIIPETHDLVILEKWLSNEVKREFVFKEKLIPFLSDYDVIIFDNGPSWNRLIENSLTSSDVVILPVGCNLLSYNACETNFHILTEFQKKIGISDQTLIFIPTLLERSSLSQQIYAQYLAQFNTDIIPIPIKSSVKAQEALLMKQSLLEYLPSNELADDYYQLIKAMWAKITGHSETMSQKEKELAEV